MASAEERQVQQLQKISQHLGSIVKILETINKNFVDTVAKVESWAVTEVTVEAQTFPDEDTMTQPQDNDAVEIHDLVEDINRLQEETGQSTTITQGD